MSWQCYDLIFRLMAPLHVGWRKSGNLQQTRGYVPGKNQWAALTARLTREYDDGAKGQRYVEIGQKVQKHFRFGYLYPALGFALWHLAPQAVHPIGMPGGLPAFLAGALLLGLCWGWVTWRSGSIRWPLVSHVLTDFLGLEGLVYLTG